MPKKKKRRRSSGDPSRFVWEPEDIVIVKRGSGPPLDFENAPPLPPQPRRNPALPPVRVQTPEDDNA